MDKKTTVSTGLDSFGHLSVSSTQRYPFKKPGLGLFTITSANKAVEPVFKGLEAPVTPANNETNLCSGYCNEKQELLLRKIEVTGVEKKYLETLEHIVNSEKLSINDIPKQDLISMLRALKFSEVSLDDQCFDKFNIKIIKTGAVIFTWYALAGTSIFNGTNNCYQYDYVREIMEVARYLEGENKPVIVVYSNSDMPDQCVAEMRGYFINEPNIITLCIETDIGLGCLGINNLFRSDSIRLQAVINQMKVIETAIEKAVMHTNKNVAYNNLLRCKQCSFIYSDVDNLFKRYPDYILAFDGVIDAPKLQFDFKPLREKYPLLYSISTGEEDKFIPDLMVGSLTEEENTAYDLIQKYYNNSKSVTWDTESNERLKLTKRDIFDQLSRILPSIILKQRKIRRTHVLFGSLQDELDKLKDNPEDMELLKSQKPKSDYYPIFLGDNGLLGRSSHENVKFKKLYDWSVVNGGVVKIAFHHYPESHDPNFFLKNDHFLKANYLLGYQLIDSITIGHDFSWDIKKESVLTYSTENARFLIKISPDRMIIKKYDRSDDLLDASDDVFATRKSDFSPQ